MTPISGTKKTGHTDDRLNTGSRWVWPVVTVHGEAFIQFRDDCAKRKLIVKMSFWVLTSI
ncbi:MAG: hypothetical protein JWP89_2354 [Schlesneria sp.]|nr:hypothetical protein [Schlesneria sp.]